MPLVSGFLSSPFPSPPRLPGPMGTDRCGPTATEGGYPAHLGRLGRVSCSRGCQARLGRVSLTVPLRRLQLHLLQPPPLLPQPPPPPPSPTGGEGASEPLRSRLRHQGRKEGKSVLLLWREEESKSSRSGGCLTGTFPNPVWDRSGFSVTSVRSFSTSSRCASQPVESKSK